MRKVILTHRKSFDSTTGKYETLTESFATDERITIKENNKIGIGKRNFGNVIKLEVVGDADLSFEKEVLVKEVVAVDTRAERMGIQEQLIDLDLKLKLDEIDYATYLFEKENLNKEKYTLMDKEVAENYYTWELV